ncbi:MAG: hypothetical protein Q4B79_00005 [Moraxella sp.]|nr:hypothetical protein [Moraxella sp.]
MPMTTQLVGEWTEDKWDYWVSMARREGKLDADELAMVSHSMMVGQINGGCQLYVPEHNKQIETSFINFAKKFQKEFVSSQLSDEVPLLSQSEFRALSVPADKQKLREKQVLMTVTNQFLESPVLQYLHYYNFIGNDHAIGKVKLTLD